MSREWKPGDVAKLTMPSGMEHIALRVSWPAADWISATEGGLYGATKIRPLAVIDPEDRKQVARLRDALDPSQQMFLLTEYQQALREFANPTPPKPAEPTGLGAVVEAAAYSDEIRTFVRGPGARAPWFDASGNGHEWNELDPVRVLSEGVTQ